HKSEIDLGGDAPQRMIGAHTFIQIDFVTEEFGLRLMNTHHSDGKKKARSAPTQMQQKRLTHLGNTPVTRYDPNRDPWGRLEDRLAAFPRSVSMSEPNNFVILWEITNVGSV